MSLQQEKNHIHVLTIRNIIQYIVKYKMSCPVVQKSGNICGRPAKFDIYCGIHKSHKPASTALDAPTPASTTPARASTAPDAPTPASTTPEAHASAFTFIELCSGAGGLSSGLVKPVYIHYC